MSRSLPTYRYAPITADQQMRILRLEPAISFDAPLVGSLIIQPIYTANNPDMPTSSYHCVSYCWGMSQEESWMLCDGCSLALTKNVDVLLRYLRKIHKARDLWIDALCINQANDVEKSGQVANMGAIYRWADKTHVWLGTATDSDQIPAIFALFKKCAISSPDDVSLVTAAADTSVLAFVTRPWFTRRWVLQEVLLSRAVIVHCGHHSLPWPWVSDGIARLHLLYTPEQQSNRHLTQMPLKALHATESVNSLARSKESAYIFSLLWDHHASQCKDERDRVFALYGLLSHTTGTQLEMLRGIAVNYAEHFSSTYTRLAIAGVKNEFGFVVLCHALTFGSLAAQDPSWPSWVPAWNKPRSTRLLLTPRIFQAQPFSRNELVRVLKPSSAMLNEVPALRVRGDCYHIVKTPDVQQAALEYFKKFLLGRYLGDKDGYGTYRNIVEFLLKESIRVSSSFYDRPDFDYSTVFPMHHGSFSDHNDPDQTTRGGRDLLAEALGAELDSAIFARPDSYFSFFSREALRYQFDRLHQGNTVFFYKISSRLIPGIAFTHVEPGDCVLRPLDSISSKSDSFALILRPLAESPERGGSSSNYFRLIGCCMDVDAWLNEFKMLDKDKREPVNKRAYVDIV